MKAINERLNIELKKLNKVQNNYEKAIKRMEGKVKRYIKFEFSICYQNSDGFVIVMDSNNAPLYDCLRIIIRKEALTNVKIAC